MKLKYYLRGLGIGILVTAIIMSCTRRPEKLTDAEIKMRATQLGMLEKSVLADMQIENNVDFNNSSIENADEILVNEEFQEAVQNEGTEEVVSMEEGENTEEVLQDEETGMVEEVVQNEETVDEESSEEVMPNEEISEEVIQNEEPADEEISEEVIQSEEALDAENVENYIIISVSSGNGSEVVSQKLFEAGLVNSAVEYNKFLVKHGYDRKLRVGNHEIPAGASEEEMAKILCGMR